MEDQFPHRRQHFLIATIEMVQRVQRQPGTGRKCLQQLNSLHLGQLDGKFRPGRYRWLFVGTGTSYDLAQAGTANFALLPGKLASGVPTSEILLFPKSSLPSRTPVSAVLISRSGHIGKIGAGASFNAVFLKACLVCSGPDKYATEASHRGAPHAARRRHRRLH